MRQKRCGHNWGYRCTCSSVNVDEEDHRLVHTPDVVELMERRRKDNAVHRESEEEQDA